MAIEDVGSAFPTKGSTFQLESGTSDIKAVLVEDMEPVVGEATSETLSASDGNSYGFAGQESENTVAFQCVATEGATRRIFQAVYGDGTTGGVQGGSTTALLWELRGAGGTVRDLYFTSPTSVNNKKLYMIAKNAKGLVVTPTMRLSSGWMLAAKFVCDYWTFEHDVDTTS